MGKKKKDFFRWEGWIMSNIYYVGGYILLEYCKIYFFN